MKHPVAVVAAGLLGLGLGLAPGPGLAEDAEPLEITLATGGPAGVYYPLGEAMAETWSSRIEGLSVTTEPTGGSVANVRLIEAGEAAVALVQNDIASYAVAAAEMFAEGAAFANLLGMAMLYPEVIQIVTLRGAGIDSVADLVGRRVAVGPVESGTEANARQILEAHGIGYDDFTPHFMAFDQAVVALRDGLIHAAFLTAGVPTGAVVDLVTVYDQDISIVPIAPEAAEEITERWPFYSAVTIPGGTYRGLDVDVASVAVLAMLVARADLEAEMVERMLEVLYGEESLRRLCAIHARGCDVSRDIAVAAMPIALHPGAESFYARD